MQVIAAIDIRGGRCVRLQQGDFSKEMIFGDDPVEIAKRWVSEGAQFLHLVDLDGAREGWPINGDVIGSIVRASGVPCEMGGGLRDRAGIAEALSLGLERVIVGTRAVLDPDWFSKMIDEFPGKLVLGLDARNGKLATRGWRETTSLDAKELVRRFHDSPLAAIVYTDIAKDGMMSGPNFDATSDLAAAARHPVIASGGITTIDDVLELKRRDISGCILGRALYEGAIKLPELFVRLNAAT